MGIYEDLGLTPIINASGAVTRLGGAPMPKAVLDAFCEAAAGCVPLEQLQAAASRKIAAATGTEAGLVTAGAAAALTLGAAAILTRLRPERMEQLPQCDGFPNEFIVAREQRQGYDHAVRAAGVRLVEVGFNEITANAGVRRTEAWEYEAAINENTAGILYVYAPAAAPPLEQVARVARAHDLPVLVDAAGELPPRRNLMDIPAQGASLVAFSGGKAIRGPQSTGILCGRAELVSAAAVQFLDMDDHPELWDPPTELVNRELLNGLPRHGLGRGFKVSKEEIAALLAALGLFIKGYGDGSRQIRCLEAIIEELEGHPFPCRLETDVAKEKPPRLVIEVVEAKTGTSAMQLCRQLRRGSPPIYVSHGRLKQGQLVIHPLHLDEPDARALARQIVQLTGD